MFLAIGTNLQKHVLLTYCQDNDIIIKVWDGSLDSQNPAMITTTHTPSRAGTYPAILRWLYLGLGSIVLIYFSFLSILILTQPLDGYSATVLAPTLIRSNPATVSQLRAGDQLVAIEGQSVETWLRQGFPLGDLTFGGGSHVTELIYTVRRNGQGLDFSVTLSPKRSWPTLLHSWGLLVPALACAAVATLLFFRRPNDFVALLIALTFMAETTNLLNNLVPTLGVNAAISLFWLWSFVDVVSFWFVLSLLLHAFFVFPDRSTWLDRYPRLPWLIHLLSPGVGILTILYTNGSPLMQLANVQRAYYVVGAGYLFLAIGRLIRTYHRSLRKAEVKGQIRWVMWGIAFSAVPWFVFIVLPTLLGRQTLLPLQWVLATQIFAPIAFGFAIGRYRLFDIDVVIERSVVYALLTGLLVATYLILVALLGTAFRLLAGPGAGSNVAIFFFSTMGAAALFSPARQYIQRLVDRLFYKQKLSFQQLTYQFNREFNTLIRFQDLANFLVNDMPEQLSISEAHLLALDETADRLVAYSPNGQRIWSLPAKGPLSSKLMETGGALALRTPSSLTASLQKRNIQIALPLIMGDRLIGIYAFGPKKSRDYYTSHDVAILTDLGYQVAVALENSRLHLALTEQSRLQREIELARATQERLIPRTAPGFPGWDLAGVSLAAQEVGGDFFGYHSLGHDRLAVAVGDVTDKGMAAALLMSGSVIALAGAVATAPRPASLLSLVNKVIRPYTGKNQNTALCYAVFRRDGYLLVANAGGIEPLVRRSDGQLEWIKIGGLPLGIVSEDYEYEEVSCQLNPGDTIVFISDGLVEARNRHNDIFGFDRLEAALFTASVERGAQSVANHLVREMRRFAGAVPPQDDVTLVVAQMQVADG
jgi:serine phosphatase RsbU (regulator of sigma subunit)